MRFQIGEPLTAAKLNQLANDLGRGESPGFHGVGGELANAGRGQITAKLTSESGASYQWTEAFWNGSAWADGLRTGQAKEVNGATGLTGKRVRLFPSAQHWLFQWNRVGPPPPPPPPPPPRGLNCSFGLDCGDDLAATLFVTSPLYGGQSFAIEWLEGAAVGAEGWYGCFEVDWSCYDGITQSCGIITLAVAFRLKTDCVIELRGLPQLFSVFDCPPAGDWEGIAPIAGLAGCFSGSCPENPLVYASPADLSYFGQAIQCDPMIFESREVATTNALLWSITE